MGYYRSMDLTSYDSGIQYEALQEVITQLIARLSYELHTNSIINQEELSEAITDLVRLKKKLMPDDVIGYQEGLSYVQKTMSRWSLV